MAEEIRSELTFEAQQAINTLNRMQAELVQYNRAVTDAASGTNAFNTAGARFDRSASAVASSLSQLSTAASGASKQLSQVGGGTSAESIQRFNKLFETSRDRVKQASDEVVRSFRDQEKATQRLGGALETTGKKGAQAGKAVLISWESVARIFAIQAIHRGVTLLTSAFADGISEAQAYQQGLAEVLTIGDDLGLSLSELDQKVRDISDAFGQPIDVVTEGLYQTLSNQVGDASQAFDFLVTANKFAIAAVTTTESSVNLLSAALNSFNLDASEADEVAGKLFKTIELGRVRADELGNTFGRVGVLSNQLGASIDETLASIATLTVQGLRFNEAFTLITNTQLKLIRPTEALKEVFAELGVESAEAAIQAFGFQGFLQKLADESGGTATDLGELFNRVRAIRGILGLTGDAAERFTDNLEKIAKAGDVELNKAFTKVFETDAAKFEREINSLRNVFVADFGQAALSTLASIAAAFGGAGDAVRSLAFGLGVATTAVITISAVTVVATFNLGAFTVATSAAAASLLAFALTPLGAFVTIAALATAGAVGIDLLTTSTKEARQAQLLLNAATVKDAVRNEDVRRRGLEDSEKQILSNTQKFLLSRQALFREDAQLAQQIQETAFGDISNQVGDRLSTVEQFVNGIRDAVNDATSAIKSLEGELQQVGDNLDQFNFDRSIKGLSEAAQASAQLQRSQESIRALNDAIAAGDTERAERLAAIARQAANAALRTAEQSDNVGLIRQAEEQVREAIRGRANIIRDQISDREKEAELAGTLAAQEESRLTRVKAIVNELQKFEAISEGLEVSPEFSPEKAKAQLKILATQLQAELAGAASAANLLGNFNVDFDNIRDQLIEKFREPITGVKIDLTDAVEINLNRIVEQLNRQADSLSTSQKSALGSLGIDTSELFRGFGDGQTQIKFIADELERSAKAQRELIQDTEELAAGFLKAAGAFESFIGLVDRTESRGLIAGIFDTKDAEGFAGTLADAGGSLNSFIQEVIAGQDELQTGSTDLETAIGGVLRLFREGFEAGNAEQTAAAIQEINRAAGDLGEEGFTNLQAQLIKVGEELSNILKEADQVNLGQRTAEQLNPLEAQIQAVKGAFDDTAAAADSVGDADARAATAVRAAESSKQQAIRDTTNALRAQAAAAATTNGAGREFGGVIFRADGGMIFDRRQFGGQRGTDSVSTLLTAGESVNTLAATRQFFPQIQAMNAGVVPQFREEGGVVNNNIGDININVTEAATGRDTAREVMKQIKREFRRNTFNIGRV